MSATPAELADRFLQLLQERTASQDSDPVRDQFVANYQQIEQAFNQSDSRDAILSRLTTHLTAELPDWEFACTANTCGIAVELGGDPMTAISAILDRMPTLLEGAQQLTEGIQARFGMPNLEAVPEEQWEAAARESKEVEHMVRKSLAIAFTGRSAMTMLSRSVDARQLARSNEKLVESVVAARDHNPYAYYLAEVLGAADGEEVVVLDIERQIGFRVRMFGVRNNFHFFTLLQSELLARPEYSSWAGPRPSLLLQEIARGNRLVHSVSTEEWTAVGTMDENGEVFDQALWTFYQWPALQPDGSIETAEQAKPYQPWWAWGEMRPYQLADLDGVRLLLLGSKEMDRSWGLGFFAPMHPAFRSSVTVEKVLAPETFKAWLRDIRDVPRKPNEDVVPEAVNA